MRAFIATPIGLEYCLSCDRCDLACPNDVNVSELIARAKAVHRKPFVREWRDFWLARPGLLGKLGTIAPRITNFFLRRNLVRPLMAKFMKIAPERTFPAYNKSLLGVPGMALNQGERV